MNLNIQKYHKVTSNIVLQHDIGILGMMLAHGHSNLQDEVFAVGIGHKNDNIWTMTKFCPVDNVVKDNRFKRIRQQLSVNPNTDYIPHPTQFMQVLMDTRHYDDNNQFDLVVIFHTHPHNHPCPSITDTLGAGYEAVYIIYSPYYKEFSYNYYDGINRGFKNVNMELL